MHTTKRMKSCASFRAIEHGGSSFRKQTTSNCKECAYFSSRNCGMDIADSLEPDILYY